MGKEEAQLLNVHRSAIFLGVNANTIRRWAKTGKLKGIKVGSRGDWRFTKEALLKMVKSEPEVTSTKRAFSKIKKFLRKNANELQKLATKHHKILLESDNLRSEFLSKYQKLHIRILKLLAANLGDTEKGLTVFRKLGEQFAKEAVKDELTIEEAVDGTIFLKQAIWGKLEQSGLLEELATQDFNRLSKIMAAYIDVLSSKIAFTYHNYYTEKIANSEERFRALTEKSSDAIALVTTKGKVIYASPTTEELMGYTSEEFQRLKNPFELVPPDDRKFVTKLFEKLLKNPGSTENAEYRVLHKNGTHIWIESDMTNLLDNSNVKAVVINYRDITDRKKLEQRKDDFIALASHELKTPVTSLKMFTQILEQRFKKQGDKEAIRALTTMDKQLTKLTDLVNGLLDVSRVEAGKLEYKKDVFHIDELVKETVGTLQEIVLTHKLLLHGQTQQKVVADHDRIGQVLTNLINNAVKYSPKGGKIMITSKKDKDYVVVSVQDFGVGIQKLEKERVFERFFQSSNPAVQTFPGLGLGLYISKEIIARHNGKLWVESEVGKGSTFHFLLPIVERKNKK